MPFDPMKNIFAQQVAQMPPDQAQVAANGVPMSLLPNDQYQAAMNQAPTPVEVKKPEAEESADKTQQGLAKYLQASAPVMKASSPAPTMNPADNAMSAFQKAMQQSMADQSGNLDKQQAYIDQMRAQPKGGIDSIDWTPLAALADAMNGGKTNLAASAHMMRPQTQEEKEAGLNDLQNKLFDKRNALSKENLASIAQQLQMDKSNAQFAETMRHNRAEEANQANRASGMDGRVGVMMGNQAIAAGQAFEKDPIIRSSKVSLNSLSRASSVINNQNKPVTTKDLALAYQDFINSVAAGGAATEGKVGREMPDTWVQRMNDLKQRLGENADLRATPAGAELINNLQESISTVRGDLGKQMTDQANNLKTSFGAVNNPMVHQTVEAKLRENYGDPVRNSRDEAAEIGNRNRPGAKAASGPHGATVTQNGHTYNWNPSVGRYE